MAYREGNRGQQMMFPPSYEEMVGEKDAVRVYSQFVDQLEVENIGLKIKENAEGNPAYHPKAMIKLLLYGYSYGIRSSRRLERAAHHNITFIWLVGGLKPDHKTISLFRKRNRKVFRNIFRQCVELCIKLKVIEGNTVYIDGSKFRGNSGIKNSYNKAQAKARKKELEKQINRIFNECDRVDKAEMNQGSWVTVNDQLGTNQARHKAIKEAMVEIEKENQAVNLTDPDAKIMKGRQGSHAGYNVQLASDDAHGLIVSNDVVNENNDKHQLVEQTKNVSDQLQKPPKTVVADKGYHRQEELETLVGDGIQVVIPTIKYARNKEQNHAFDKSQFHYEKETNRYRCPMGHYLIQKRTVPQKYSFFYQMEDASTCQTCPHFGVCTTAKTGRNMSRLIHETTHEKIKQLYQSPKGQAIYRKRGYKIEPIFGHFKRNMGISSFLLRGLSSVQAEMNILATNYNLTRLISLWGSLNLQKRLGAS